MNGGKVKQSQPQQQQAAGTPPIHQSISSMEQEQDDTMRLNDFETFKQQFTKRHLTKPGGQPQPSSAQLRESAATATSTLKGFKMSKKSSFEEAQVAYEQRRKELIIKVDSPLSPPPSEPLPTVPYKRRPVSPFAFNISFTMGLSNFLSSRFWAATVVFYLIAWLVTLGGLASIQDAVQSSLLLGSPGGLAWFNLVLGFALVAWIIVAVANGTGAIWNRSLLSVVLIVTVFDLYYAEVTRIWLSAITSSNAVTNGVRCYFAGLVLQLLVTFPWMLMLGSHPQGFPAMLGDYTMHSEGPSNAEQSLPMQSMNSPTLTTATKMAGGSGGKRSSRPTTPLNTTGTGGLPLATPQAPLLARALYTYKANPDDPNELSFDKGEMLEIIDNRGKWWQVKRRDGNGVAIAPSNYLQLVN